MMLQNTSLNEIVTWFKTWKIKINEESNFYKQKKFVNGPYNYEWHYNSTKIECKIPRYKFGHATNMEKAYNKKL